MMKILFTINDPPYGTERVYNALRLAHALPDTVASGLVVTWAMRKARPVAIPSVA
jgi:uncharacterized protein involved in oxidation of intracellular sulfur